MQKRPRKYKEKTQKNACCILKFVYLRHLHSNTARWSTGNLRNLLQDDGTFGFILHNVLPKNMFPLCISLKKTYEHLELDFFSLTHCRLLAYLCFSYTFVSRCFIRHLPKYIIHFFLSIKKPPPCDPPTKWKCVWCNLNF